MAQLIALLTSNPMRLRCQVRRVDEAVELGAGPGKVVGVGYHDNGKMLLRKRPGMPPGSRIESMVGDVRSELLLATRHQISPTGFREEDSEPFRFRSWLFAGVGRILPLGERQAVLATLPEFLRLGALGRSDAELAFLLTLAHIHESSRQLDHIDLDPAIAADALAKTLAKLDERANLAGAPLPETAAVLSNGRLLAAVRRGRPLSYALIEGLAECELCEMDRATPDDDPRVRPHRTLKAVVLASKTKPDSGLQWIDVPENHLLTVSRTFDVKVRPID